MERKKVGETIKFLLSLILLSLISQQTSFADPDSETVKKLADYLHRVEDYGFSGQVLIAEKGNVLLIKGYGLANRKSLTPITEQTVFDIASLTKQFTAAAILRLEMEGKLKTTDSIEEHLEGVPTDKTAITIQQLITHTSGLRRDVIQNSSSEIVTRDETVKRILQSPLVSKTGEQFIYSNAGYNLLAAIIEKKSGQSYIDYLNQSLFKPAGMKSTFLQTDYKRKKNAARPYNEWREFSEFYNRPPSWHFGGPSGISTNVGDIYKWIQSLQGTKVLSKIAKEKFISRQKPLEEGVYYGYGWFIEKTKNGTDLISSGGDVIGFHSEFRWEVQNQRLIIILTNQDVFGLAGGAVQKRIIADNLTHILDGERFKEPTQTIKLQTVELNKYKGTYSLPSGGLFKVWLKDRGLSIGAEGQDAINLLLYPNSKTTNLHNEENQRASLIFETIGKGETANLKQLFSTAEYDTYITFLEKEFQAQVSSSNKFSRSVVRGTIPFPYNKNSLRTYIQLEFGKEKIDIFLGWNKGKINDVTFSEGKPFPLILPIAPQSKTNFATFDLFSAESVPLTFILDEKDKVIGITLQNNDEKIRANKIEMTD